jgi:diguanylate cyclase (GGDEF)-like protein
MRDERGRRDRGGPELGVVCRHVVGLLVDRLRFTREDVVAADAPMSRTLMARTGAWLFLGGGALVLLVLALPHDQRISDAGLLAVSAGCFAGALVALLCFDSLPTVGFELLAACASTLATAARLFAEDGAESGTGIQALYLWIVLYAAFFFARRRALLQVVWIAALYGAVLTSERGSSATVTLWTVTIGGLLVAALVIGALRERVLDLVERLADAARTDPLTALLNRRGFDELFNREVQRARRADRPFSVLVGDLDSFKRVNDRHGHAAGDSALRRAAHVLQDDNRATDSAARLGGEEFAVIVPETDEHGAYVLAERVRRAVADAFAADATPLTISFGIVSFPKHGRTQQQLLQRADEAMYAAKRLGRDRSVIHSATMLQDAGRPVP